MNSTKSSNAGYWLLVGLAVLMSAPVVIGHFVLNNAQASASQDASVRAESPQAE